MPSPSRRAKPRTPLAARPRVEQLEGREVPATLIGLTTADTLVTFDSASPGKILTTVAVTGLAGGESLVGIDYRPANGQLYGITTGSRVYTLDPSSGVATAVGGGFTPALSGTAFAVDFNPLVDRIRVVGNDGQNLRIDPTTGQVVNNTADTPLVFDPADPQNQGFFGTSGGAITPNPQVTGAAYTRNFDATANKNVTTLYGIDSNQDLLVQIGSPDGTPNNPNGGQVVVVDQIRDATTFARIDFNATNGFDIEAGTDKAFAVTAGASGSTLYGINITSGAATSVGSVGGGLTLEGLAIAPPAAGSGTFSLSGSTFTFPANRAALGVTVTRTGGASTAATVNYATADGSAVGGADYLPVSGTLSFGVGETTRTIFLLLPSGPPAPAPAKTFTLTLSAPTNGATLGSTTSATVTIPAVSATPGPGQTAAPKPTRFFAVGAGVGGGPRVVVYDAVTRVQVADFFAYESTFRGGVQVATGDVNRDGVEDIIVGTGPGGGPRVRVFDGSTLATGGTPAGLADFFAYEDTFRGGVQVSAGDVNGDGYIDIITGVGVGGGPRVRAFAGGPAGVGGTPNAPTGLLDFFAYEAEFRGGVNVGSGNFNNDKFADVIAGAGVGGGPRVQIFSGADRSVLANYFAYDPNVRTGVQVAGGDVNGNGRADVIAGTGAGGGPNVKIFDGTTTTPAASFFAYASTFNGGVRVATLDANVSGATNIVTAPGPGAALAVKVFDGTGTQVGADLPPLDAAFAGGLYVG